MFCSLVKAFFLHLLLQIPEKDNEGNGITVQTQDTQLNNIISMFEVSGLLLSKMA